MKSDALYFSHTPNKKKKNYSMSHRFNSNPRACIIALHVNAHLPTYNSKLHHFHMLSKDREKLFMQRKLVTVSTRRTNYRIKIQLEFYYNLF